MLSTKRISRKRKMWFESSRLVEIKSAPMFNETFPTVFRGLVNSPAAYADIDFCIERNPEAIAILNAIITDMKPHSYRFIPVKKTEGEKKVAAAKEFAAKVRYSEEYAKTLWDGLLYGDDYMWMGVIPQKSIETLVSSTMAGANATFKAKYGFEYKAAELDLTFGKDEDSIKSLRHVPANTMNIDHDKKEIIKFRQIVGDDEISWAPEIIMHNKLMTMKGKVYGFSPTIATLTEMSIIGHLKDFAGTFFKNGGIPDWMFILPTEMAGSKNHKALIRMLTKYKNPQNKHGNLVFTGEVTPHQLNKFDKDMEFRQLAVYLTGVLALAHNMPLSRVASIIGSEIKISAGADDLSNEGYWNKIDELQCQRERMHNSQLWEPFFGVKIRFDRGYKQNEVREVQRAVQAGEAVSKINMLLANFDQQVSLDYIKSMFYLDESDLEEGKAKMLESLGSNNQPGNKKIMDGPAKQAEANQKKKQVIQKQKTDAELKALEVENKAATDRLNTLQVKETIKSIKIKNKLIKKIENGS